MNAIASPRLDAASLLAPNSCSTAALLSVASADGLTIEEAIDLVAWLKETGSASIEVVHEANMSSVRWSK